MSSSLFCGSVRFPIGTGVRVGILKLVRGESIQGRLEMDTSAVFPSADRLPLLEEDAQAGP